MERTLMEQPSGTPVVEVIPMEISPSTTGKRTSLSRLCNHDLSNVQEIPSLCMMSADGYLAKVLNALIRSSE